jgi:hypothetical protein
VFAAVCVLLAALGHVMASGSHVSGWALGAGAAVTAAVGWCLTGRERGLPMIVAVVVAAQTALHSAFSLAPSASGSRASTDTHTMGSMHMSMDMGPKRMGSTDMGHVTTSHLSMGHMEPFLDGGGSSFGMLAAHLLAALLTGLWLAHGEKAAFRILRTVAGWLAAPLRLLLALPVTPDGPFRVRPGRPRSDRAPSLLLVHAITSRGPPGGAAV